MTEQTTGEVQEAPVQETPEGTPPVENAPEEQQVTTGTPGTPTPDGVAVEKTPEQVAQDAAHWQTESQKAKEALRMLQNQRDALKAPEYQTASEARQQQIPQSQSTQQPLSDNDLADKLRDDPLLLAGYLKQEIGQLFQETTQLAAQKQNAQRENEDAGRIVANFCTNNKVSGDDMMAEYDSIRKLVGDSVPPSAMSSLVMDGLTMKMMQGNLKQNATEAAAHASAAVKQAALTTQPLAAGGAPEVGEKTQEQTIADKFKQDPSKSKIAGMFG